MVETRRLDLLIFVLVAAAAVLVPLAFSTVTAQYDLVKTSVLKIMALLVFAALAARALTGANFTGRLDALNVLVIVFLALSVLSTLFSVAPRVSLFGNYGSYEGLTTLALLVFFFFVARQQMLKGGSPGTFLKLIVAGSVPISTYGLLQFLGYEFLPWLSLPFEANRSFATFGNPTLLAGYLVMMLPIALALLLKEERVLMKPLWGGAALLGATVLLTTYTRGGWLSGIFALIVFGVVGRKYIVSQLKTSLGIALIGLLLMSGAFLVSAGGQAEGENLASRAASIGQVNQGSIDSRFEIWKSTWTMIQTSPLVGYGPDTFRLVFPRFETLAKAQGGSGSLIADNAHNYFLHLAATSGIPGAAVFVLILLASGREVIRRLLDGADVMYVGILAALAGYTVNIMFTINATGSALVFWLLLGLVSSPLATATAARTASGDEADNRGQSSSESRWDRKRGLAAALLQLGGFVVVGLVVAVLSLSALSLYRAEVHANRASVLRSAGIYDGAVYEYGEALSINATEDTYHRELGRTYLRLAEADGDVESFDLAIASLTAARQLKPLEFSNSLHLGQAYLGRALRERRSEYLVVARSILEEARAARPFDPTVLRLLGQAYLESGEEENALRALEQAIVINRSESMTYYLLGQTLEELGRPTEAASRYEEALTLAPDFEEARSALEALSAK